jgi:hypothetical protein
LLATIAILAISPRDLSIDDIGYCGIAFVNRFAGQWPGVPWTQWCCTTNQYCHMQFHARYLRECPIDSISVPEREGILIQRETTDILCQGLPGLKLRESRMATCIMTGADRRLFAVTTLRDQKSEKLNDLRSPNARKDAWSLMRVNDCDGFQWAAVFQVEIYTLLPEWHQEWNTTLSLVDAIVVYSPFQVSTCNGIHSFANAKL